VISKHIEDVENIGHHF